MESSSSKQSSVEITSDYRQEEKVPKKSVVFVLLEYSTHIKMLTSFQKGLETTHQSSGWIYRDLASINEETIDLHPQFFLSPHNVPHQVQPRQS